MTSAWQTLSSINVNDHIEKKGNLTYLSWAWAWGELKTRYPEATFEKHFFDGLPYALDSQGFAYVMVSVTVEDRTVSEVYPVTDHRNASIQNPDSFAVNTALQRCLTKAIAYHGLGHYIYAGEDLPNDSEPAKPQPAEPIAQPAPPVAENLTPATNESDDDLLEIPDFLKRDDDRPNWAANEIKRFKDHQHLGQHQEWLRSNGKNIENTGQEARAALAGAYKIRENELLNKQGAE